MSSYNIGDVAALAALHHQQQTTEAAIRAAVDHLREQGCPWSVIGQALGGLNRQTVHMRYTSK